jgi:hypothetical protein
VGNLALSIALVRTHGLVGVAIGTAVPVTLVAVCGLVPAACRRVQMPFTELFRGALWPALWPAAIAGSLLVGSRTRFPATLSAVALQFVIGGAVYFALFLLAVGHEGRREYLRHVEVLLKRRPRRVRVGTANAS